MGKFVWFPTQLYEVLSGRVGKRFLSTLNAELGGIRGRKWNAEQVIIFQTVILQRIRLIIGANNIRAQINTWLDLWNSGTFKERINDSYAAATVYLGRARRNKTRNNFIVRSQTLFYVENCARPSDFLQMGIRGGGGLPKELATNKTVVTEETVKTVLAKKHTHEKNTALWLLKFR